MNPEPPIVVPERVRVLMPQVGRAANGIPLYAVDTGSQDVVRISLVFRAGTKYQSKPFCASATLNMLSEGSREYDARRIAELLDFYGIYYDVTNDRDYAVVTFAALGKFLPRVLDLLRQVLAEPVFPEEELDIYKEKRKQELRIERRKVDFMARESFARALYGAHHPYGVSYGEDRYDGLHADDLRNFHREYYRASDCFCVVTGKVGSAVRERLLETLAALPEGEKIPPCRLPDPLSTPCLCEPVEGALQSAIRAGRVLFDRGHPDFIGMQVLSTVLGGYFGSRLVRNLREDKGYTYGAFSVMVNLEDSGYLAVATEVGADVTQEALEQVFAETGRLRREPVGGDELQMVRNVMIGEVMRVLDGPFGIADVTIENLQNGDTNAYVERFVREVNAITPERLLELARKYLAREDFSVVVVGKC